MDNKESDFDRTKREMLRDYFILRDKIRLQEVFINKQKECFLDTAASKDKVIGMEASITKEHGLVVSKIFERTEEPKFGSGVHDLLKDQGIYDYKLLDDGSLLVEPTPHIKPIKLQTSPSKEVNNLMWEHVFGDKKPEVDYVQITRDIANT